MNHYSYIVLSNKDVPLPEHRLFLTHGRNVFNIFLDDVGAFRGMLAEAGVTVVQENRLDEFEPVPEDVVEAQSPSWDEV